MKGNPIPQQNKLGRLASIVGTARYLGNLKRERDALIEYILLLDERLDEVKNLILHDEAGTRR